MRKIMMLGVAAVAAITPAPASADTVTDWWEIANRFYLAGQGAGGMRTPDAERASTRVALAMFEAVNAIDRRYESYLNLPRETVAASQDAAAATAAYKVLLHHYPANKGSIDDSYAMAMAEIAEGPAKAAGIKLGERAAEAAINAGGIDPAIIQRPYRPRANPGEWIGASPPSLEPYWVAFKPWAIGRVEALRPPPPPPLTSAIWARDYEEVRRLGSRNSKERTPAQTLIAKYRQGYDLAPMVRFIADRPGRSQVANARLIALYQMAFDDAAQAMVAAKQHYDFWRPITAIRNGDRDGNDMTPLEHGWVALLPTPNFSESPCGPCTVAAAQAEVLKLVGGLPASTRVRVSAGGNPNMPIQTVKSWDELVRQVSDSRMFGGVHYRFSNDAGEEMGRRAARIAVERVLRPLPSTDRRR